MTRLFSLNLWLGLITGAALASLLLHGADTVGSARGIAGLCLGTFLGFVGLIAFITVRNRWANDAQIED
jgi:hypothetical protein